MRSTRGLCRIQRRPVRSRCCPEPRSLPVRGSHAAQALAPSPRLGPFCCGPAERRAPCVGPRLAAPPARPGELRARPECCIPPMRTLSDRERADRRGPAEPSHRAPPACGLSANGVGSFTVRPQRSATSRGVSIVRPTAPTQPRLSQFDKVAAKLRNSLVAQYLAARSGLGPRGAAGVWGKACPRS